MWNVQATLGMELKGHRGLESRSAMGIADACNMAYGGISMLASFLPVVVSLNRGTQFRPQYVMILIHGAPQQGTAVPLILGNPHLWLVNPKS